MTVSSTTSQKNYDGDGSVVAFPTTFKFLANDDITVILRDVDNLETTLSEVTHYTLVGAGDDAGGTVTMITAPTSNEMVVIKRITTPTQGTDYVPNDPFPAESHEEALDRVTMLVQENARDIARVITAPASDVDPVLELPSAADRAGEFLAFDGNGDAITSAGTGADAGLRGDLSDITIDDGTKGFNLVVFPPRPGEAGVVAAQYPFGDVRRYGAVGDGATNDTTAFTTAATAVGAGVIEAPHTASGYNVASSVTIGTATTRLYGTGQLVGTASASDVSAIVISKGNLGVGETPRAWHSAFNVVEIDAATTFYLDNNTGDSGLAFGCRSENGTDWLANSLSIRARREYRTIAGEYIIELAPVTAADAVISWDTQQTLNTDGTLEQVAGIYLGGTATANLLDDYEEGTWTPTVGGTSTYTSQIGTYTKVGRSVTVSMLMHINLIGTGSTTGPITGLPFTTANAAGFTIAFFSTLNVSVVELLMRVDSGSTSLINATLAAAGATASSSSNIYGNNTRIIGSMAYEAT